MGFSRQSRQRREADIGSVANTMSTGWPERRPEPGVGQIAGCGELVGMGDTKSERCGKARERIDGPAQWSTWAEPNWIECQDNKYRPIKSGLEPLANGIPARVVRLRGYGNAIVPQVAAEFIQAHFEVIG
jgi:DNA (cytosine-5)-methyltransferase 1